MRRYPYYLYHICREKDKYDLSKGYIGVSSHPKIRWSSGGYKENPHLSNALKKYGDVIHYVVICDTRKSCLAKEKKLRPDRNIGWNIAKGGGMPPSPKGTQWCVSKLPKSKRRKNFRHTEESKILISKAQQKLKGFHRNRMLGDKNPMSGRKGEDHPAWTGWYVTPKGKFPTSQDVCDAYNISRPAVFRRCKKGGVIGRNRWTPKEWWGKSWEELGWGFKPR